LANVQRVSGKEQSFTKNRCQQVGVLPGAHGAEQDDLGYVVNPLRERPSSCFEHGHRRGCPTLTPREALQILRGHARVRRHETIRHRDDVHSAGLVAWGVREGARILQLATKVQPA
jgi:hypothetical protein